ALVHPTTVRAVQSAAESEQTLGHVLRFVRSVIRSHIDERLRTARSDYRNVVPRYRNSGGHGVTALRYGYDASAQFARRIDGGLWLDRDLASAREPKPPPTWIAAQVLFTQLIPDVREIVESPLPSIERDRLKRKLSVFLREQLRVPGFPRGSVSGKYRADSDGRHHRCAPHADPS